VNTNALREIGIALPKRKFSIKDKIREMYKGLVTHFKQNNDKKKIAYTSFVGKDKEERIISFAPLLHLETQKKIWLEQETHFEEIYIWLKEVYFKHNPDPFADLKEELKEEIKELEKKDKGTKKRIQEINKDFENPLAEMFD
jgi:hypothetical protein